MVQFATLDDTWEVDDGDGEAALRRIEIKTIAATVNKRGYRNQP